MLLNQKLKTLVRNLDYSGNMNTDGSILRYKNDDSFIAVFWGSAISFSLMIYIRDSIIIAKWIVKTISDLGGKESTGSQAFIYLKPDLPNPDHKSNIIKKFIDNLFNLLLLHILNTTNHIRNENQNNIVTDKSLNL